MSNVLSVMGVRAWEREVEGSREYSSRRPSQSPLYQIVSGGGEKLKVSWELLFEPTYGTLRNEEVESFEKFLECGIIKHGCGRAECTNPTCKHSELIPFSCKQRCLCPSCDAKRAVLFGEKLHYEVLLEHRHQHVVFTIPKRIRPYFKYDRSNLGILYQSAWEAWSECIEELCPDGTPGVVMALHSAGEFLQWHPHIHSLCLSGAVFADGSFERLEVEPEKLCEKFQRNVLRALVAKGLIAQDVADNMLSWEHSGFSTFIGEPIEASDVKQRLFVGRYLKKCPISNERLRVSTHGKDTTVILSGKGRGGESEERSFSLLRFLAHLQCHLPCRWEQTTRYFGVYSCRARGEATKSASSTITITDLPEPKPAPSPRWAACLKRTFELDPLKCPRCGSEMKLKAFITDPKEAARIAKHLGVQQGPAPPPLACVIPLAA